MNALTSLQAIYARSSDSVRPREISSESAKLLYRDYINFIQHCYPSSGDLLDVGCGNGWSAYLFSQSGYNATGIDLNGGAFEPPPDMKLKLVAGSALELPFPDGSFDVVCAFQVLEHIPDPQRALSEMIRVVRPGGMLFIVGPNINSPLQSLRGLLSYTWRNRPLNRIFLRTEGMPKHPAGNTVPECFGSLIMNIIRTAYRLLPTAVYFEMRQPDLTPPFHADNDCCYRCNPHDVIKYLKSQRFKIKCTAKPGRPQFLTPLAAGTWIAAEKSSPSLLEA